MKNLKYWVLLVLIVFGVLIQQREPAQLKESTVQFENQVDDLATGVKIQAKIIRCIDGDTGVFEINDHEYKIRYLLIDTPETVDPNSKIERFGPEASARSKKLLSNAQLIEVQLDETNLIDTHGRLLAHIFVDGEHLQNILVREGLARIYFIKNPEDEYLQELKESEAFAKASKLGIWSKTK